MRSRLPITNDFARIFRFFQGIFQNRIFTDDIGGLFGRSIQSLMEGPYLFLWLALQFVPLKENKSAYFEGGIVRKQAYRFARQWPIYIRFIQIRTFDGTLGFLFPLARKHGIYRSLEKPQPTKFSDFPEHWSFRLELSTAFPSTIVCRMS